MKKAVITGFVVGILGAALFYSPYVGLNAQTPYTCLVCPDITTMWGTPFTRFLRFSFVMGVMNGLLFATAFCLVVAAYRLIRKLKPSQS